MLCDNVRHILKSEFGLTEEDLVEYCSWLELKEETNEKHVLFVKATEYLANFMNPYVFA